ncbi:MAG: hypothetical protein KTR30_37175 [Saprospiraceae bacterium]|nr:hypothetical protein [Saprospiraceae bacterium]
MKIRFLNEDQENTWNTYFFGSSRVHNQIDPAVFDHLVNLQEHHEIRSFNLGAQGAFPPQSYFLFEKFLDSKHSDGVKFCFLELRELARIKPANSVPANHSYWLSLKEISFALRCLLLDPTKSRVYKRSQILRHLRAYVENVLHIGHFKAQISTPHYYDDLSLGPEKNGYLPCEYQYEMTQNKALREALLKKRKRLEEEPERLQDRSIKHLQGYKGYSDAYYSEAHQERVLQLIERAKEKGIHLILIYISSGTNQNPGRAINLCRSLPKSHIIELANPTKFPELYYVANAFDPGHLNAKGSRIFTRYLAQEFKKIKEAR